MKRTIAMHQERNNKHKAETSGPQSALPAYLLERDQVIHDVTACCHCVWPSLPDVPLFGRWTAPRC